MVNVKYLICIHLIDFICTQMYCKNKTKKKYCNLFFNTYFMF